MSLPRPDLREAALAATLAGRLSLLAARRPDDVALREKDRGVWREISWREYGDRVAAAARALAEVGVGPGDHVAILSDNQPEWLYADLGAQGIGARSVGIYQTNPPRDVAYVLAHSGCRVLFCRDQEQVDKAIEIASDTPTVERVVVFDPRGTRGYDDPRLETWADFVARGRLLLADEPGWFDARLAERDPDAPSMVVYTSGTTGPPKGALLSCGNAIAVAERVVPLLGITARDTVLSYLPLCHVAEKIFSLFLPLTAGAVVHFGESIDTVREDLREVSPTVFLGVPRIWEKLHASVTLKMKDASWLQRTLFAWCCRVGRRLAPTRGKRRRTLLERLLSRVADLFVFRPLQERLGLRRCRLPISGAAPISPDVLHWFHGIGVRVVEGYGMTECAGVSHLTPPDAVVLGSVGVTLPGLECAIGMDGEILVRGPNVFRGYLHDEASTRTTVDEDGWLHTGDVGTLEDGYLFITGRKKEIIITAGGKNLSPEKIENALKTSPYIKEAVAIGDGRSFVSALVQIDYDATGDWATRQGIPYTTYGDLAAKPAIHRLVDDEVRRANELLARVEQVRAFRILRKELHQDDGELTATQKVRRQAVLALHGDLIENVYGS